MLLYQSINHKTGFRPLGRKSDFFSFLFLWARLWGPAAPPKSPHFSHNNAPWPATSWPDKGFWWKWPTTGTVLQYYLMWMTEDTERLVFPDKPQRFLLNIFMKDNLNQAWNLSWPLQEINIPCWLLQGWYFNLELLLWNKTLTTCVY